MSKTSPSLGVRVNSAVRGIATAARGSSAPILTFSLALSGGPLLASTSPAGGLVKGRLLEVLHRLRHRPLIVLH
jgi:hypothetical protein